MLADLDEVLLNSGNCSIANCFIICAGLAQLVSGPASQQSGPLLQRPQVSVAPPAGDSSERLLLLDCHQPYPIQIDSKGPQTQA